MRSRHPPQPQPPPPPPGSETEDSSSDSSSDGGFDDKDNDDADNVSEVSEGDIDRLLEDDLRVRHAEAAEAAEKAARNRGPASPVVEEPLDEFEKDPWNAVGVFGLRVYYKMPAAVEGEEQREAGVRLRVERPNPYVWDESSDEDESEGEEADD